MQGGHIDAIALTSSGQVRRLVDAARGHGREAQLRNALAKTPIASVGPVVSDELHAYGFTASITPAEDAFFMRPLISAMSTALARNSPS
jgi:uroporphyrinogen-III synthase